MYVNLLFLEKIFIWIDIYLHIYLNYFLYAIFLRKQRKIIFFLSYWKGYVSIFSLRKKSRKSDNK